MSIANVLGIHAIPGNKRSALLYVRAESIKLGTGVIAKDAYMDVGGRATQEQLPSVATAAISPANHRPS